MKLNLFFSVMVLFGTALLFGTPAVKAPVDEFRSIDNKAFKEGEKLTFDVSYGFVTAGVATMHISKIKKMGGRDTYHTIFSVNSVPSFDPFYKVRDRYETYIDTKGIFPWRYEEHIREGKFSKDYSVFFDQRKEKAKSNDGEVAIPKYAQDIISAFYYVRTMNLSKLKVGEKIFMENFYNNKMHKLEVEFLGRERITVAAGTFDCLIVEPLIKEGGLSEGRDQKIVVWVTDDNKKMPVKVKTKVMVGAIEAELTAYEGTI